MRKKSLLVFTVILGIILVAALVGCQNKTDTEQPNPDDVVPSAVRIAVDETSIPSVAYAGVFDVSDIRLIVYYSDDSSKIVQANSYMVDTKDASKLSKVGTHNIHLIYSGMTTYFVIKLEQAPKQIYSLRVEGGRPTKINDRTITEEIEMDGNVYEGEFEEGTEVTVEWIVVRDENGVQSEDFVCWLDNGIRRDTATTTRVVMNTDHVYRAQSSPMVHTVSFVTNCDTNIGDMRTNTLEENSIRSLEKVEGQLIYIFDGWTTEQLTGSEAINNNTAKRITFPYNVLFDVTLYATWRTLPLIFTETDDGEGYLVSGYNGADEVNIKEVVIPEKYNGPDGLKDVLEISPDAFLNAQYMESLFIPRNVKKIGSGFVRNCPRLMEIDVDRNSAYFMSDDGILYSHDQDVLVAYPAGKLSAGFFVPQTVKEISAYAFNNAVVGSVELGDTLETIGAHAFDSVHIIFVDFAALNPDKDKFVIGREEGEGYGNIFNDRIENILVNANSNFATYSRLFEGLTDKMLDKQSQSNLIGEISVNEDGTLLYREIYNENSLNPEQTIEIIGADRRITELTVPRELNYHNVSSIGYKAFNGCIYLRTVNIYGESNLERILEGAFDGTPYVESLENHMILANNILYKYLGTASTFTLPRDVVTIAERAFENNKTLTKVDFSSNSTLTYIGAYAFSGCDNLKETIGGDGKFVLRGSVETIGNYAFINSGIRFFDVTPDNNLTTIGMQAFRDCHYLKTANIGRATVISADAFIYCYSLSAFSTSADNRLFKSLSGVLYSKSSESSEKYTVLFAYPAGRLDAEYNVGGGEDDYDIAAGESIDDVEVTKIANFAFFMSNIATIYIPATVTQIESDAFHVPGLIGVKFEKLTDIDFTYWSMFVTVNSESFEKYEPEYISSVETPDENALLKFFDSQDYSYRTKYIESVPAADEAFYIDEDMGMLLRYIPAGSGESERIVVVRADRQKETLVMSGEQVSVGGHSFAITSVSPYAFMGYYLTDLTISSGVSSLEIYSLYYAGALSHLRIGSPSALRKGDVDSELIFGERFNNGLFIYVENPGAFADEWGKPGELKYIIDETVGKPQATFTYSGDAEKPDNWSELVGNDEESTFTVAGTIEPNQIPIPRKGGYDFEGWKDENGNIMDFSTDYVIPYNITFTVAWVPMTYTIHFEVGDNATMTSYTATQVYGEPINLEEPLSDRKVFLGWRFESSDGLIAKDGNWEYALPDREITLIAVWENKKFVLRYQIDEKTTLIDTRGEDADKSAVTEIIYGEQLTLYTAKKEGYTFNGWNIDAEQSRVRFADKDGKMTFGWSYTDKDEYSLYPIFIPISGIRVELYRDYVDGEFVGEPLAQLTMTYDSEFTINYVWTERQNLFCGWLGEDGTRYTDENGKGLFLWNKLNVGGEAIKLYAQWALEVGSEEDLAVLEEDMTRSIILTSDIEITKPIGSFETPYTGLFNGAGHIVTFNYTVSDDVGFDGYVGLFKNNAGTIRNFNLVVNINVTSDKKVTLGGIAAINSGVISDVTVTSANISVNVKTLEGEEEQHNIGGLVGINTGDVIEVSIQMKSYDITVDGSGFTLENENIYCGVLFGSFVKGTASTTGSGSIFRYSDDDNVFVRENLVCGYRDPNYAMGMSVTYMK